MYPNSKDALISVFDSVIVPKAISIGSKSRNEYVKSLCSTPSSNAGRDVKIGFFGYSIKGKGKVLPYSLPSVGPGADPGVQAVSLQVTLSHPASGRLPLLCARPAVTFPAKGRYQIILLGDRGTWV